MPRKFRPQDKMKPLQKPAFMAMLEFQKSLGKIYNARSVVNSVNKPEATGRKKMQYTGDKVLGIIHAHKSNWVPVMRESKEQAIEVTKMRRG